jgi:glycosyltransferase involved in cell wall biosynthesis
MSDIYEVDGMCVYSLQPKLHERAFMLPFLPTYYLLPEINVPVISWVLQRKIAPIADDVELIHNIRIGREHLSWASYKLARKKGIPFFITPNFSPRMQTFIGRFVLRNFFALLRRADGVFVFTEEEKQGMLNLGVPEDRLCLIGVGPLLSETADPQGFRRSYGINGPMVLFLGQKLPYKGFHTLLSAASIIWQRYPDVYFVFMGPHYGGSKEILSQYNDPRIIDIPAVPPFDPLKSSALAACTVLAVPSRQEGIGGVYIEAWTLGKPVIACDIPFVRTVVEDGRDGFLIPQDPRILADRIIWLLRHPEEAQRMGEYGRDKVRRRYSWDVIVRTIEDYYAKAIYSG